MGVADDITTSFRPMSSWSLDRSKAVEFAKNRADDAFVSDHQTPVTGGIVYDAVVPCIAHFSPCPRADFGCLSENEVVVLGGTDSISAGPMPYQNAAGRNNW